MVLFLPGRFGDAEVRSQSIYTAIDLLSFYHDCILNRPRISLQCGPETSEVKTVKVFLNAVQIVEVLIEMMATRQLSRDQKWLIILMIESLKYVFSACACFALQRLTLRSRVVSISIPISEHWRACFYCIGIAETCSCSARRRSSSSSRPFKFKQPPAICPSLSRFEI
jgi:peroxin-16